MVRSSRARPGTVTYDLFQFRFGIPIEHANEAPDADTVASDPFGQAASTQKLHFFKPTVSVRLNMIEPENRKALSLPKHNPRLPNGHHARYTAERVLRTRPKTYRKIVHLLADPYWSVLQISKNCRVSEHTVHAIRERESQDTAERKKEACGNAG